MKFRFISYHLEPRDETFRSGCAIEELNIISFSFKYEFQPSWTLDLATNETEFHFFRYHTTFQHNNEIISWFNMQSMNIIQYMCILSIWCEYNFDSNETQLQNTQQKKIPIVYCSQYHYWVFYSYFWIRKIQYCMKKEVLKEPSMLTFC